MPEISSSEIKANGRPPDKKRHFPVALIYYKPKLPDIVLVTVRMIRGLRPFKN